MAVKRRSKKASTIAARSKAGKSGWTPERRAAASAAAKVWRAEQLAAGVATSVPEDLGFITAIDWLHGRGVTIDLNRESPWFRQLADPPDDPVELVKFRVYLWLRASNPEQNAFRAEVLRRCTGTGLTDVNALVFFTKCFVWQNNPAMKGKEVGPFIPWGFQREAWKETVDYLLADDEDWQREDMAWEKSREMGATWLMLILALWICACHKFKRVLALSHTERAVTESANEDTLFGKIEFILDRMPVWAKAGAYKRKNGFRFHESRSQIMGAATTKRSGVSNRVTIVLGDEFSKMADAEEIWSQTASTGPRLICGTHYGSGTKFHSLTQGRQQIRKQVIHWSRHPIFARGLYRVDHQGKVEELDAGYSYPPQCPECSRIYPKQLVGERSPCCGKDGAVLRAFDFVRTGEPTGGPYPGVRSPWYDRECKRRNNPQEVASHLDINPKGGVHQFFDALTIERLKAKAKRWLWEGDVEAGKLVERAFGPLRLWEFPNVRGQFRPGRYAIACDVATGTSATPSCLAIIDAELRCRVGSYANARIEARPFATLAVDLCNIFTQRDGTGALLGWEFQGPGVNFGIRVDELGYSNVWCQKPSTPAVHGVSRGTRPGWDPSATGAILAVIGGYRDSIQDGTLTEHCVDTLDETLNYVYDSLGVPIHPMKKSKGDPSGSNYNHGDRTTAAAIALMLAKDLGMGRDTIGSGEEAITVGGWQWRRDQAMKEDMEKDGVWVT